MALEVKRLSLNSSFFCTCLGFLFLLLWWTAIITAIWINCMLPSQCSGQFDLLLRVWLDQQVKFWAVMHQRISLQEGSGLILYKYRGWMRHIYVYRPWDNKSIPACTRKAQGDTANSSWWHLDSWAGESLGTGETVLMNDFQSMAASYSKQSPSPQGPCGSYLPLREKWMKGALRNKWSLTVWHLQMIPSCKTKSILLFHWMWRWLSPGGTHILFLLLLPA